MKKAIICIVYLLTAMHLSAVPYGILDDDNLIHASTSAYAIDNLLDGRAVRYAVGENCNEREEEFFTQELLAWPRKVLSLISRGRRHEFRDIVSLLERGITLVKVSPDEDPDIFLQVVADGRKFCRNSEGCFVHKQSDHPNTIYVTSATKLGYRYFSWVITHELGHYYGLADQYERERKNAHPEYSSNANDVQGSIMQGSCSTGGKITCDDADGFINLIDLRLSRRNGGRFSRRARWGWKSVCPNPQNKYKEARTVNRSDDSVITFSADTGISFIGKNTYALRDYRNGKIIQEEKVSLEVSLLALFNIADEDQIKKDDQGRIIQIASAGYIRRFDYTKKKTDQGRGYYLMDVAVFSPAGKKMRMYTFTVDSDRKEIFYRAVDKKQELIINPQEIFTGMDKDYSFAARMKDFEVLDTQLDLRATWRNADGIITPHMKLTADYPKGIYTFAVGNTSQELYEVLHDKQDLAYTFNIDKKDGYLEDITGVDHRLSFLIARSWQELHIAYVQSFRRNFYPFLFNQSSNENIQTKLKQTLQSGVTGNTVKQ